MIRIPGFAQWMLALNGLLALVAIWSAIDRSYHYPAFKRELVAPGSVTASEQLPAPLALDAFRNRPVFLAARKIPTPEEAAAGDAPPPPPVLTGYRLSGVIVGMGKKLALLQPDGSNQASSVPLGGSVQGWQLVEIDANHATFELQGNRTVLSFVSTGAGKGGP